jgi:hypothetical protein
MYDLLGFIIRGIDVSDWLNPGGALIALIPLAGVVWFIVATLAEEKTKRQERELLHRERVLALEKGKVDILEESIVRAETRKPGAPGSGLLVGGIVTIGAGLAISAFLALALDGSDRSKGVALGVLPVILGASLIVGWWVSRRITPRSGP